MDTEKWQHIFEKVKPISIGVSAILLACVFVFKWVGSDKGNHVEDFISAELVFDKWQQDPSSENWQKLQKKIEAHPELHKKFGAAIAQRFLHQGEVSTYYFETLLRAKDSLGSYATFAEISEKITQKQYEKALEEAIVLKKNITDAKETSFLQALNLVRIAMLQKELGLDKQEIESWKELRMMIGWNSSSQEFAQTEVGKMLTKHFSENEINIQDYILYRENELAKAS